MTEKLQTFLITVAAIEGRHYAWPNINSVVLVKIDNQKKYSAVKYNSDCPYYNEYFVFEFLSTLDKFLDKTIIITVLKPGGCLKKRKTLGFVSLDVATVWYQQDHQFYQKWAILSAPTKDLMGGTRGYLKLNISVLSKGDIPKIPLITNTDEIEGNLLLPEGTITERQRANFIFDIYRGEDFVKKLTINENAKKSNDNIPSPSIEIVFAGLRIKTSTKKNTSTPEWNERLILPELFPPLCQRIRVELHLGENKKYASAFRYLNLRSISNDKEEGFLPMFGPTFLYFYSKNNLEGYMGKILIGLHTELLSTVLESETKPVSVIALPPTRQEKVLKFDEFGLFASILGVSSISHKYHDKPISFRIGCGSALSDSTDEKINSCVTSGIKPQVTNRNLCYLPLDNQKPCLSLFLVLPDFRKRMYTYNHITKIARNLKLKINEMEKVFNKYDHNTSGTQELIMDALDFVVFAVDKYIEMITSYDLQETTILEQERTKMVIKEMENIKQKALTIYLLQSKRKCFQKIEKLYSRFEALTDDLEDWPRIYIWMIYGNKRVAYYLVEPKTVINSLVEEERGVNCGSLQTIYFQSQNEKSLNSIEYISMVAKMDVIFWIGLVRHKDDYLKTLPEGFQPNSEEIPNYLIPLETYEFQCRIHIFQGRFTPGSDKSGLCDPFIHVVIDGQYRETQILRKTLNPIWDQTLVFTKIIIQGSRNFIRSHPPTIFIEVYDRDECCRNEFIGRAAIVPLVKMAEDPYSSPFFPPKLAWSKIYSKFDVSAEILAAYELLESSAGLEEIKDDGAVIAIPSNIKPILVNYKIEVFFWGVRNLKKVQMMQVSRPKLIIECVSSSITSDTLVNAKKNLNFSNPIKSFEVVFSEQEEYAPPLWLKIYDCRNFGINVFAGTHIVPVNNFLYTPMTAEDREKKLFDLEKQSFDNTSPSVDSIIAMVETQDYEASLGKSPSFDSSVYNHQSCNLKKFCSTLICCKETESTSSIIYEDHEYVDKEDFDWWTKFYASMEDAKLTNEKTIPAHKYKLKIFPYELELQPEFAGFTDILTSFRMYKGKRTGDEAVDEENTTAVFKGSLKIYRWPPVGEGKYVTVSGLTLENGIFQDFPSNGPLRYVLRVYCVRAIGLRPKDLNGKSDPYLLIGLNEQIVNDKENCVMRQVNPVFGRCFEFNAMFPQDHTLTVAVYDWDLTTKDDLIGETKIDLENRFYTQHRANCGLAEDYQESGYCQWRDQQKPAAILEALCKKWNLSHPEYGASSVKVAHNEFQPDNYSVSDNKEINKQVLALAALRRWQEIPVIGRRLVPEHVETRSLHNPNKPGIEQGKLQLWIDIFPFTDFPTPKQVNIAPRKPVSYELRVIVWNADDIKLDEDDFFTGEKKSDIFIKGWLGEPDNVQYTDIHYRSISGEGNFNWRFVFPFDYLSTENKLVVKRKETFFTIDETEFKLPCRLTLQVWDNDSFSADEFLGTLSIELSRLPRGARAAKKCTLALLKPDAPVLNLFKVRRTKGWWPFRNFDDNNVEIFAGSVEIEMELVSIEDAEKGPAGLGRDEPQGLPKPKRPDTSFSWFRNPFKAIKYIAKLHKWKIFMGLAVMAAILMLVVACYAFPGYTVKKILGA